MSTEAKTPDAKPPLAPKRPSRPPGDDGDKPAAPQRAGTLPTGLSRAIVISAVIFSVAGLIGTFLFHRYAVVPSAKSENALAYRIDTLTGRVSVCSTVQCQPVPEK